MRSYRAKKKEAHRTDLNEKLVVNNELSKLLGIDVQKRLHGKRPHLTLSSNELSIVEQNTVFAKIRRRAKDCSTRIPRRFLKTIEHCPQCKINPSVLILVKGKRRGLCEEHWEKLSKTDAGWG